jgi:phosphatidylglycerophosphate synthase
MAELGTRREVAVSILGKIKTITQMVALGFLIYEEPFIGLPVYLIGIILIYIAVFLTLISMFQYLVLALPKLKK